MQVASGRGWPQAIALAGVMLGCLGAIAMLQQPQLQQIQNRNQTASVEELQQGVAAEKARLELLQKMPGFGFDNVIADWTFLNFLQYFGDTPARRRTDYRLSPEYFEVILSRDPRFLNAYIFLSTSTALYAGMPERSIAIAARGLEHLSPVTPTGSFYAWRGRGIDELLFLGDPQAARRSFETAAAWAEEAGTPEGKFSANISRKTAEFLARNPNSKAAQVAAWIMVLGNAPDQRTRRLAIDRIESLGAQVVTAPDGSYQIKTLPSNASESSGKN